jgi:hypothetical protein
VILIDDSAVPTTTRKLKKWTDDFTDARNWVIRQLHAFRGDRYFAGIFDHKERRSVFKEKGRWKLDLLDSVCLSQMGARRSDAILPLDFFKIGAPLAQWRHLTKWWIGRLQRVCETAAAEELSDGEDVVPMFFLMRYQTVVATRREINLARQFCRVSLVHRMETNVARQFFEVSVDLTLLSIDESFALIFSRNLAWLHESVVNVKNSRKKLGAVFHSCFWFGLTSEIEGGCAGSSQVHQSIRPRHSANFAFRIP